MLSSMTCVTDYSIGGSFSVFWYSTSRFISVVQMDHNVQLHFTSIYRFFRVLNPLDSQPRRYRNWCRNIQKSQVDSSQTFLRGTYYVVNSSEVCGFAREPRARASSSKMRVLSRLSHKYKRYNMGFLKVTYAVMDASP